MSRTDKELVVWMNLIPPQVVDDILEAAMVEKKETFEEIVLRIELEVRSNDVLMKCSNCDFEASDKEDYYNHIVDNHATEDYVEEGAVFKATEDSENNIEEETLKESLEVEPMMKSKDEDDLEKLDGEEGDVVQRILDSILIKVVDVADKRKEWEERLRRNILPNKNPNLLFSTLGSSQEPFDDEDDDGESESEDEDDSEDSFNSKDKKEASSSGLDSLEVLKEQEKYLLDNIVKDLVELESLDIDIVGGRAGLKVKEEEGVNIKEEKTNFWEEEELVTDFQDQYQIFAENLINPMENAEKKNSKRKKLKAMSKKKKKMKRMKEVMDDDDEGEEEDDLLATSSEVLRGLLASPANSIGRCGNINFAKFVEPIKRVCHI